MRKTEGAVLVGLSEPLEIKELEIPELAPGQVLVDIAYSGLCHSQLNEIFGRKGDDPYIPHTLGHEGSGTVIEIGEGVSKVAVGDRVIVTWIAGEGNNVPACQYSSNGATINSGAISTFVRRMVASENRLVPIAETVPMKEAALFGCAIPTGVGAVFNNCQLSEGMSIAIFGAGGVGLSAVIAARAAKAKTIIAVDINPDKLEVAQKFGATHVVDATKEDALELINQITEGMGVDRSFEAAGTKQTMETAYACVRRNGGLAVMAGNLPKGSLIEIDPMDLIQGKNICGTAGGECRPDKDIPNYIELYLKGDLTIEGMISKIYPLKDINQAVEDLDQGRVIRAMIDMQN